MKINTNSLKSIFSNKKVLLIFGIFLIIGLILILLLTLGEKEDEISRYPEPDELVEQPYNYDNYSSIQIPPDQLENMKEGQKGIDKVRLLTLLASDDNQDITSMLSKLGVTGWSMQNFSDVYYMWSNKALGEEYFADYDNKNEKLFFRFPDPIDLDLIEAPPQFTPTSGSIFLKQYMFSYLGRDVDFTNVQIEREGNFIRINANRSIDGIPVHVPTLNNFTDSILITENGELVEGDIRLFDFGEEQFASELIEPEVLARVITRDDYPKNITQRMPLGWDYSMSDLEDVLYQDGIENDAPFIPEDYALDIVKDCTVVDSELVYYFVRSNEPYLSPSYRFLCMGEIEIEDKPYDVPLIIFASALDPALVALPERFNY